MDQFKDINKKITSHNSYRLDKKVIIAAILFFVVLVGGMFTFAVLKKTEIDALPSTVSQKEILRDTDLPYPSITRVTATHFYIDGVHTLVGEVSLPTPCDLLDVETTVMESFPEQVVVDFSVINTANFCAETITSRRFKVSVPASENASFVAEFMGRQIELNLIPASEDDTPDEFELFIKG